MSDLSPSAKNYFSLIGRIDPLSEIKNAGIVTTGHIYWVKHPSDLDYDYVKACVGNENLFDTIQGAINKCVSDQNDYVMVCPRNSGAAWALTTAIDLNKNAVHLISVGYGRSNLGYSNTIEGYATGIVHDDEWINITGHACEVAGFRFSGTGAATAAIGYGTVDNGMVYVDADQVWVHDCHLVYSGSAATAWDKLGKGFVALNGSADGVRFTNLTFHGGTTNAGTPTLINIGAEAKDCIFEDSSFVWGGAKTDHAVIRVGTGDIGLLKFKDCSFVNFNAATAVASLAVGEVTAEEGIVLFHQCSAVGVTAMGTNALVRVVPSFGGGTINNLLQNPGLGIPGTALIVTKT